MGDSHVWGRESSSQFKETFAGRQRNAQRQMESFEVGPQWSFGKLELQEK
jgi:hypothetical protein